MIDRAQVSLNRSFRWDVFLSHTISWLLLRTEKLTKRKPRLKHEIETQSR